MRLYSIPRVSVVATNNPFVATKANFVATKPVSQPKVLDILAHVAGCFGSTTGKVLQQNSQGKLSRKGNLPIIRHITAAIAVQKYGYTLSTVGKYLLCSHGNCTRGIKSVLNFADTNKAFRQMAQQVEYSINETLGGGSSVFLPIRFRLVDSPAQINWVDGRERGNTTSPQYTRLKGGATHTDIPVCSPALTDNSNATVGSPFSITQIHKYG